MYTAKGQLDVSSMLKQYSPLVRRLAHQMIAKLPANVEIDDLIQVGMIGLTDALSRFDGDLIINALPAGVEVQIPPVATIIEAAYSGARTPDSGRRLLEAQAIRQNELFVRACST